MAQRASRSRSIDDGTSATPDLTTARFFYRHAREIREGGFPVVIRKGQTLLLLSLARLAVLTMRALRIRPGRLLSHRIGHFSESTELYLCERDLGLHHRRTLDIFFYNSPICNQQLKTMWDRTLPVFGLAGWLNRLSKLRSGHWDRIVRLPSEDHSELLARTRPHLSFTSDEERRGEAAVREMGVPAGSHFVCFHARDSAYLDARYPEEDWRYHDNRDSSIHNYMAASEELTRRGYFALRMGAIVQEALASTNPKIIDYASRYRTDFLDIFLAARCRFFLASTGGLTGVPLIFRRPIGCVNLLPLGRLRTGSPHDLFIPKKLWLRGERRLLTFREIVHSGVGRIAKGHEYERLGIEPVENSPEEIAAVAVEMDDRLNGVWRATEEDEELQKRFWALYKLQEPDRVFRWRIGTGFLRQNRELLE